MSIKSNGKQEDTNVVRVTKFIEMPYAYIPYSSLEAARSKHPNSTLYIFEPGSPVGYRVVAFPIQMTKPETDSA